MKKVLLVLCICACLIGCNNGNKNGIQVNVEEPQREILFGSF